VRDDISFWTKGYPEELKMYLSQDLQTHYHQLKIGDMFEIR
jgi:L-ascorbate 6-phosphate lactonase